MELKLVNAGGDRFSRPSRKASASRALARTQTAGASEPSAVTGDAVSPTSEKLDPCSRTGAGGAATDFSRPSRNGVATACPCTHTDGEGVGARCEDRLS